MSGHGLTVPTRDDGDASGLVPGHFLCQRHAWAQKRAHPTPILPRLIEKLQGIMSDLTDTLAKHTCLRATVYQVQAFLSRNA